MGNAHLQHVCVWELTLGSSLVECRGEGQWNPTDSSRCFQAIYCTFFCSLSCVTLWAALGIVKIILRSIFPSTVSFKPKGCKHSFFFSWQVSYFYLNYDINIFNRINSLLLYIPPVNRLVWLVAVHLELVWGEGLVSRKLKLILLKKTIYKNMNSSEK